jgi:hypothetical protein
MLYFWEEIYHIQLLMLPSNKNNTRYEKCKILSSINNPSGMAHWGMEIKIRSFLICENKDVRGNMQVVIAVLPETHLCSLDRGPAL